MSFDIETNQSIGGRPYQEDFIYEFNGPDLVAVGVFDGHGGKEAAEYTSKNLIDTIRRHPSFNENLSRAIRAGFQKTHFEMWSLQEQWPLVNGYPSTAGTTATIAIIRDGYITIGHCGDSGAVVATKNGNQSNVQKLTTDHKPIGAELVRIENAGGQVINERVVWFRSRDHFRLRNTVLSAYPFLNMSRSLGDYWSFNERTGKFVVSPEPDIIEFKIDGPMECLILGSDGLFDIMDPEIAVGVAMKSKRLAAVNLVNHVIKICSKKHVVSDNVSAIVVIPR